jgi:hypothetical protein
MKIDCNGRTFSGDALLQPYYLIKNEADISATNRNGIVEIKINSQTNDVSVELLNNQLTGADKLLIQPEAFTLIEILT